MVNFRNIMIFVHAKFIIESLIRLLYSWKFFPNSARSHWLYFEVTWHLAIKLFPAEIVLRARQCSATCECWPTIAVTEMFSEFPASKLQLNNKSLKDWSIFESKLFSFSVTQKLTVFFGTSHFVLSIDNDINFPYKV